MTTTQNYRLRKPTQFERDNLNRLIGCTIESVGFRDDGTCHLIPYLNIIAPDGRTMGAFIQSDAEGNDGGFIAICE